MQVQQPATTENGNGTSAESEVPIRVRREARILAETAKNGHLEEIVRELVFARHRYQKQFQDMHRMLDDLANSDVEYFRTEQVQRTSDQRTRVLVFSNHRMHELPVSPVVSDETLQALEAGSLVAVNRREMMVVGVPAPDSSASDLPGELVPFREYYDVDRTRAIVESDGRSPRVIYLSPTLQQIELLPGDTIVTARDDERWGVGRVCNKDRYQRSRYEVPVSSVRTRLSDLAGLQDTADCILEEVLPRLMFPDVRRRFSLQRLSGLILHSRPGMGKTALMRALFRELHDLGTDNGFDVQMLAIPPTSLKSSWHGGDGKNVRELKAEIEARRDSATGRATLLMVLMDELDSVGTRSGHVSRTTISSAQNDVVQALLDCIDGIHQPLDTDQPFEVLWCGLTNWLEGVDSALKRPDRFGNLIVELPELTFESSAEILSVYLRNDLPFLRSGQIQSITKEDLSEQITQPALAEVFEQPALSYTTEGQRRISVSAGRLLTGASLKNAAMRACRAAACRQIRQDGPPAVSLHDVVDGLVDEVLETARAWATDINDLRRNLKITVPVASVKVTPEDDLRHHRFTA